MKFLIQTLVTIGKRRNEEGSQTWKVLSTLITVFWNLSSSKIDQRKPAALTLSVGHELPDYEALHTSVIFSCLIKFHNIFTYVQFYISNKRFGVLRKSLSVSVQ
jgi:hypothetical protein